MPLDPSSFPEEVQVAFFVFSLLPDEFEGMSGTYMGKQWAGLEYIFELHNIQDKKEVFFFMKIYENKLVRYRAEEAEKKRKANEQKAKASKGGGINYTHKPKR